MSECAVISKKEQKNKPKSSNSSDFIKTDTFVVQREDDNPGPSDSWMAAMSLINPYVSRKDKAQKKSEEFSNTDLTVQKKSETENSASENKTGIPDNMKSGFENLSGFSFDDVQVHYNSDKPAQLQAFAYTQGNEIHIAPGQEKHLGHELGHVVQQKQGRVRPTVKMQGVNVNDNEGLEKEADTMGIRAAQKTTEEEKNKPIQLKTLSKTDVTQLKKFKITDSNQQLNTSEQIRDTIGDIKSGSWVFPNQDAGEGCVGKLCVSKSVLRKPTGATKSLAIHQTFNIDSIFIPSKTSLNKSAIRIEVRNLHMTARCEDAQDNFSSGAETILDREGSTHAGSTNDWIHINNRAKREALISSLDFVSTTEDDKLTNINDVLAGFKDFTTYSKNLKTALEDNLRFNIDIPPAEKTEIKTMTTTKNW